MGLDQAPKWALASSCSKVILRVMIDCPLRLWNHRNLKESRKSYCSVAQTVAFFLQQKKILRTKSEKEGGEETWRDTGAWTGVSLLMSSALCPLSHWGSASLSTQETPPCFTWLVKKMQLLHPETAFLANFHSHSNFLKAKCNTLTAKKCQRLSTNNGSWSGSKMGLGIK